jgi:hypothetical protein
MGRDPTRSLRDPIRHCELYKYDGCSHVDGFLCRIETCKERLEWVEFLLRKNPEEKNSETLKMAPENKKWEKRV